MRVVILFVILGATFLACDTEPDEINGDTLELTQTPEQDPGEPRIYDEPDYGCAEMFASLQAIRNRTMQLISQRNLSEAEIQALERGDGSEQEVLGISDQEYESMRRDLERANDFADEHSCDEPEFDPGDRRARCKGGYGICLIGAGVGGFYSGPNFLIAYTLIAWNCYCGYCEGGYTEELCL